MTYAKVLFGVVTGSALLLASDLPRASAQGLSFPGVCRITSVHNGKPLEVFNGKVTACACFGNGEWILVRAPGTLDCFTITSARYGRSVDVALFPAPKIGEPVQLFDSHGGKNQVWRLVPKGDAFVFQSVYNPTKVLDLPLPYKASNQPANQVQIFPANGGANQLWRISRIR